MYMYVNDKFPSSLYPDELIDIFLDLFNKIKEKFTFINKHEDILLVDKSLSNIDLLLDSINKLANVLEANPLFEDEFLLSISIINHIEFIRDRNILNENIDFIANIVINFCKLICDKQDWVISDKNFNYEKEYDKFYMFFINQREEFYDRLPNTNSNEDNELIDKVTNLLWWFFILNKNLFLDTNVIIGFIFSIDPFYNFSKNVFSSKNNLYYSYNVKYEVENVYLRKKEEYDKFFLLIFSKLRKFNDTDFISLSYMHNVISNFKPINNLSVKNMQETFDLIWKFFNFGENQEVGVIKLELNKFNIKFNKKHYNNKKYCNNINYIPAHRQKDYEIIKMIENNSLEELFHDEDKDVLFDLHEFNKNNPHFDFIFVCWDNNFIKGVSNLINKLSFDKYIGFRDMEILIKNNIDKEKYIENKFLII